MKKIIYTTLVTLACAGAANTAFAEDHKDGHRPPPHHRIFEEMDANSDGAVTKAESAAFHEKKFAEIDANKDGKITKEESESFHEAKRAEWKKKHGKE